MAESIAGARWVVVEGAGHAVFIDDPETFNVELRRLLAATKPYGCNRVREMGAGTTAFGRARFSVTLGTPDRKVGSLIRPLRETG
jgi:hypothetical protein